MKNGLYAGVLVAFLGLGVVHGQQKVDDLKKLDDFEKEGKKAQNGKNGQNAQRVLPPPNQDPAPWQIPAPPRDASQSGSNTPMFRQQNPRIPVGPTPGPPPGDPTGPLSDYLTYLRPSNCCGPIGGNGPIMGEAYFRPGISIPIGSGILGKILDPGLMLQGGIRSLFFDTEQKSAWTVDIGITTFWNDAGLDRRTTLRNFPVQVPTVNGQTQTFILPTLDVTPSSLNQTYLQLAFGQEHYLLGTADCCTGEPMCRWGWDLGGRYGSAKMVFNEIKHLTDIVGGCYGSVHADMEIPYKCCVFTVGFRTEMAYIWSDILQSHVDADLVQLNFLLNLGVRY